MTRDQFAGLAICELTEAIRALAFGATHKPVPPGNLERARANIEDALDEVMAAIAVEKTAALEARKSKKITPAEAERRRARRMHDAPAAFASVTKRKKR